MSACALETYKMASSLSTCVASLSLHVVYSKQLWSSWNFLWTHTCLKDSVTVYFIHPSRKLKIYQVTFIGGLFAQQLDHFVLFENSNFFMCHVLMQGHCHVWPWGMTDWIWHWGVSHFLTWLYSALWCFTLCCVTIFLDVSLIKPKTRAQPIVQGYSLFNVIIQYNTI